MKRTSLDKKHIKVLLLESIHPSALETLRAEGYTNVERHDSALPESELTERIRDAHLLGIRSRTKVPAAVLAQAERLIAIGCFCIGTDQVDLAAAQERGVPVFNAPFSNTRSVAELVIGEIILLCRGIPQRNAAAHRGEWLKGVAGATEVRGKTLGIVGYGHIGTQVGVLAEALGMRVVYHDIETKLGLGNASSAPSLEALLEQSHVITLHVPETVSTAELIGAEQLSRMRQGAFLINASRGTVVDLDALTEALDAGHLGGAAIDVFPSEPGSSGQLFESPLRRFDNVLLTPHVAGSTVEAQENIGTEVAAKLVRYSDNGSTLTAVNFPQVALPEHPAKHRVLHIHRNEPGVLARVNAIFSASQINIASQYLETSGGIGYAVTDVEAADGIGLELKRQLDGIDATIRTRVLY